MVRPSIVVASVASVQLALLTQISVGLPIGNDSKNREHCKRAVFSTNPFDLTTDKVLGGGAAALCLCLAAKLYECARNYDDRNRNRQGLGDLESNTPLTELPGDSDRDPLARQNSGSIQEPTHPRQTHPEQPHPEQPHPRQTHPEPHPEQPHPETHERRDLKGTQRDGLGSRDLDLDELD